MELPTLMSVSSQAADPQGRTDPEAGLGNIEFTDEELRSMAQSADLDFLALLGMC